MVQGVTGDQNADPGNLGAGIWTNPGFSGTDGGHQILNNIIQDNIMGIELDNTGEIPALVQHNLIKDNNISPGAGSGTGIGVNFGLNNATIDQNEFTGQTSNAIGVFGGSNNVTISANTILNDSSISLFGASNFDLTSNKSTNANGSAVFIGGADSNIHLDKNVLVNANGAGVEVSDPFTIGANSGVLIEHGGLRSNDQGVLLGSGAISDTLQVHRVRINVDNTQGVVNNDAGNSVIDATKNWWGRSSGPSDWNIGVGATTSQEVDFFPWALHPNFSAFQSCTVQGTPGDDIPLNGTPGKDVICGGGGNDQIKGFGGRDLILGEGGNDVLQGGSSNDALIGGPGDDSLQGDQGTDDTGQGRDGIDFCANTTERCSTTE